MESSFKCGQIEQQRTHKYQFTAVLSFTGRWSSQKSEARAGLMGGSAKCVILKILLENGYNGWKLNRSFQHFTQWLSEFRSNCRSKYPFILWACSENCSGFCIFSAICHQTLQEIESSTENCQATQRTDVDFKKHIFGNSPTSTLHTGGFYMWIKALWALHIQNRIGGC